MRTSLTGLTLLLTIAASLVVTSPASASVPDKPFTETQCEGDSDSVARLYTAGLGREPEQGGFDFWITEYTLGNWTFPRMAEFFVASPEFEQSYGTLTQDQFIRQLYINVLGREGEAGGMAFWNAQMNAGMTRATVLMRFAESPENITNSGTVEPTLGPFNEGRVPGAWRCGPSLENTLLQLADFPANWLDTSGSGTPPASPTNCETAFNFASTETESVQFVADGGGSIFGQAIYLAPTPHGAERYLDQTRQAIIDCAVHQTSGGLNVEITEINAPGLGDDSVGYRLLYTANDGTVILDLGRVAIQDGPVATVMAYTDVDFYNPTETERLSIVVGDRIANLPFA